MKENVNLSNKQCFYRNNKMFLRIKLQHVFKCCLSALTQPHNCFATHLLPCRWCVVQSWPRNPLFGYVMSLLLLWKPHSWF